jgi:murein DD-endopeptidase MepM/ murein hydrolase activator NlpD
MAAANVEPFAVAGEPNRTSDLAPANGTRIATVVPTPAAPVREMQEPVTPVPTIPAPLELPWPPPDQFILVTDGGPIDPLAAIWGYETFPVSQEFGHTAFSVRHPDWYAYGAGYGLDGFEHPGLDVGMPAGTPLYSPVNGTVQVAGGVPYYTFYGNGQPGVGELLIETSEGDQVILGHMGRIVVEEGQQVTAGELVGLSGGENGDHLHLEARERQVWGGYRIVDPRESFLIDAIAASARDQNESRTVENGAAEPMPTAATLAPVGQGATSSVNLDHLVEVGRLIVDSLRLDGPEGLCRVPLGPGPHDVDSAACRP